MQMFTTPTKENKKWKGLIYGAEGTRKTRFTLTLPKPVTLDLEKGTVEYSEEFDFKVKHIVTADDVMLAVDYLLSNDHDFSTLIIDPVTVYWSALQKKWTEIFFNRKKSGAGYKIDFYELQIGDWLVIKSEFKAFLRKISMLDMNVVFTAHEKPEYAETGTMVKTGEYLPDCEKSLPYFFDTVLRFTKDKEDDTIIYTCKDRSGKLPKSFRLDGDTFAKCTGISGDKAKPVVMITEAQLEDLKGTEVMLISNDKYKITPDAWNKKIRTYGCPIEDFTSDNAEDLIKNTNEYIEKINSK